MNLANALKPISPILFALISTYFTWPWSANALQTFSIESAPNSLWWSINFSRFLLLTMKLLKLLVLLLVSLFHEMFKYFKLDLMMPLASTSNLVSSIWQWLRQRATKWAWIDWVTTYLHTAMEQGVRDRLRRCSYSCVASSIFNSSVSSTSVSFNSRLLIRQSFACSKLANTSPLKEVILKPERYRVSQLWVVFRATRRASRPSSSNMLFFRSKYFSDGCCSIPLVKFSRARSPIPQSYRVSSFSFSFWLIICASI